MADAIWPLNLPQNANLRELEEQPQGVAIATEMDAGADKLRRRHTRAIEVFPIRLDITRTQGALLLDFFYSVLLGGTLTFEWKHPRTEEIAECRFRKAKPPTLKPLRVLQDGQEPWIARFEMEIVPGAAIDEPVGATCLKMFGATGATVWGTDSTLTVEITAACAGATAFYNAATASLTFIFEDSVLDGSGQLQSVSWIYEDPPGTISRITFDRDAGWSFDIDPAHWPATSCGSDSAVGPGEGTENGVTVLNKGMNPADEIWATKFCGSGTQDWMQTLEVTHNPGSCPGNAARGDGFLAYAAICTVTP